MNYYNFKCDIDVKHNPLNLNIHDFLSVALRNNKKRKFLFVSKSLGKHIPVNPSDVDKLGESLASAYKAKYKNYISEKQIVIGFAETATCLSHSFFNYLESAKYFIHTTRENAKGLKKLEFLEEHSHATEQNLYLDELEEKITDKDKFDKIILVDDEITTAKTCINMISKMQKVYNIKNYVIVSILNWIDEKRYDEIRDGLDKLGCKIEFVYLFNGKFDFKLKDNYNPVDKIITKDMVNSSSNIEVNTINLDFPKYIKDNKYLSYTGRFGISKDEQKMLLKIIDREAKKLTIKNDTDNILCLGLEEFMYIPMMLSKRIKGNVYFHSTTRSPIIPIYDEENYPIKEKYSFESFYNTNVNFIYNLKAHKYDECFIFMEVYKDMSKVNEFIKILNYAGIKSVTLVEF